MALAPCSARALPEPLDGDAGAGGGSPPSLGPARRAQHLLAGGNSGIGGLGMSCVLPMEERAEVRVMPLSPAIRRVLPYFLCMKSLYSKGGNPVNLVEKVAIC